MPTPPEPVSRNVSVRHLVAHGLQAGRLSAAQADAVLRFEQVLPTLAQWRDFLRRLFLFTGALALACGVVFFFAFNWQDLPRLSKFGLLQGVLSIAALYAWRRGPDDLAGRAGLLGAMLLCGALLAYLGQTYQTGADTFELFLAWALLITPWAIAARLGAAWALWLALVNLAVLLYFARARSDPLEIFLEAEGGHVWLFWLNGAVLLLAEWLTRASPARLFARFAGVFVLVCAGAGLAGWSFGIDAGPHAWQVTLSRLAMLATLIGFLAFYRRLHDMVMLAATVAVFIALATSVVWRMSVEAVDPLWALLVLGVFLIVSSAAAAAWLRAVQRRRQGEGLP